MNRKKPEAVRNKRKRVLFSDNDLKIIDYRIQTHNAKHPNYKLDFSKYVRECALKGSVVMREKVAISDEKTLTELKRVGANINQIAKRLNSLTNQNVNEKEVLKIEKELTSIRSMLTLLHLKVAK